MNISPVQIPVGINARVPPTPGPRSMEHIQADFKVRFAGIWWNQKDPDRTLEDFFIEYDHWEPYSETKIYSKRIYQAAYTGILRDYHNHLCILEAEDTTEYYVVAKRVRNELEALEPYCPCITCSSSSFNPLKYIWCPTCTRCIKAGRGFAKEEYIERARIAKEQHEAKKNTPGPYDRYLKLFHSVRVLEAMTVSVVGVIGLYCWF